jgi:hypothetical protein
LRDAQCFGPTGSLCDKLLDNVLGWFATFARGMAKAAVADTILYIEDEIIALTRRDAHGNGIEAKCVSSFPGDHMVRTGSVSADAQAAHEFSLVTVEGQAATEHDHSADRFANHGIVLLSEVLRVSAVSHIWIRGPDNAVERLSRLGG